jgi:hypothetical protein
MGGRGAMMNPVGDRVYEYKTVEIVEGVKVLEPKKKTDSWGMPHMSNTPGTSYIMVSKSKGSAMFRKYGMDRHPVIDIEYGTHQGVKSFHAQTWKDGVRQEGARPLTRKELKKYGKLFKKAGLKI